MAPEGTGYAQIPLRLIAGQALRQTLCLTANSAGLVMVWCRASPP